MLQPITVRPMPDGGYEIIAGERRWRAHGVLIERGYGPAVSVLCNVRDMDDHARDIMAIIENLQRVDVAPVEEARAFQRMVDIGLTVEDLARKLGRQVRRVEERLRLMTLEPSILKLCEGGFDHHVAQEIARLPEHRDQLAIIRMWNRGGIVGFAALKAAINAKIDNLSQEDFFGSAAAAPNEEDLAVVRGMEAKVERMLALAAAGFKDGECKIAQRIAPDKTVLMADKINALKKALTIMERDLRCASAQAEIFSVAAE